MREERREIFERATRGKEDTYPTSKLGETWGKGDSKRNHHPLRWQVNEGAGQVLRDGLASGRED